MTDAAKLKQLGELADLIFEMRLSRLETAARAKSESEALLRGLDQPAASEEGLIATAAAVAGLAYQRWAERRRSEINLQLARQTAEWHEAREGAREAFGRTEALRRLLVPKR